MRLVQYLRELQFCVCTYMSVVVASRLTSESMQITEQVHETCIRCSSTSLTYSDDDCTGAVLVVRPVKAKCSRQWSLNKVGAVMVDTGTPSQVWQDVGLAVHVSHSRCSSITPSWELVQRRQHTQDRKTASKYRQYLTSHFSQLQWHPLQFQLNFALLAVHERPCVCYTPVFHYVCNINLDEAQLFAAFWLLACITNNSLFAKAAQPILNAGQMVGLTYRDDSYHTVNMLL